MKCQEILKGEPQGNAFKCRVLCVLNSPKLKAIESTVNMALWIRLYPQSFGNVKYFGLNHPVGRKMMRK